MVVKGLKTQAEQRVMNMRVWLSLAACVALAACDPAIPDSGDGVGFGDYESYSAQRARDAALASPRRQPPANAPVNAPINAPINAPLATVASTGPATGAPSAAEINAALGRDTATPAPQAAAPVITPAAPARSGTSISDEQDFQAVSSRESIESDAQRIERQRAQYQQAPVTALPSRPQDTGPNLAEYALSTSNAPGEKVYRRGFTTQRRYDRACGSYASSALAQTAFLKAGGPQRDKLGVDPDGDGFACAWDPRPFRAAKG